MQITENKILEDDMNIDVWILISTSLKAASWKSLTLNQGFSWT